MKALSIKQPWATMIAQGDKTIETRKWGTEYRGDLLIVSAKSPRIEPAGYALAIVSLVGCRLMTERDEIEACCRWMPGTFAWLLEHVRKIEQFPVRGQLGLFDVEVTQLD